jgi:hypothetical protein
MRNEDPARLYWGLAAVFGVWMLAWIFLSWPAMQDDAFIHLRYAANLSRFHLISYDGAHQDYGTSSLLYVWLLAALYKMEASPLLPRAVSSFFHVVLFACLVLGFARTLRSAPKLAWGFALLLLAILVAPMSVRWLDDGMETSLTLCFVALTAFVTSKMCHRRTLSDWSSLLLFLLGFTATLLRVEYLFLFGVVSATIYFAQCEARSGVAQSSAQADRSGFGVVLRCASPLAGSLTAAGWIYFTMHALVPDTAVAKAGGFGGWMGTLQATASVLASALSLGALFVLFWLLTLAAVITFKRRISIPILLVNSLFPVTVALAAVRGQAVQGVRYFIWTLLFPVLWNILELRWGEGRQPSRWGSILLRSATYGIVAVFLVLLPIESVLLYKEFRMRVQSISMMRSQHLERLHSLRLVAYDIGYIGYFTQSPVCDMAGLVNGRERAMLSPEQRVRLCAEERPQYAFLTRSGIGTLNNVLSLGDWSVCSVYNLANLRHSDLHYLIASPASTAAVCSAAGNSPRPIAPLLHP